MKNRIAELRREAGITQEALADAVGVTRRTAISLERQGYVPSVKLALQLALVLKTPVEEVFLLDDEDCPVAVGQ